MHDGGQLRVCLVYAESRDGNLIQNGWGMEVLLNKSQFPVAEDTSASMANDIRSAHPPTGAGTPPIVTRAAYIGAPTGHRHGSSPHDRPTRIGYIRRRALSSWASTGHSEAFPKRLRQMRTPEPSVEQRVDRAASLRRDLVLKGSRFPTANLEINGDRPCRR